MAYNLLSLMSADALFPSVLATCRTLIHYKTSVAGQLRLSNVSEATVLTIQVQLMQVLQSASGSIQDYMCVLMNKYVYASICSRSAGGECRHSSPIDTAYIASTQSHRPFD